jgi:hypothetical protein
MSGGPQAGPGAVRRGRVRAQGAQTTGRRNIPLVVQTLLVLMFMWCGGCALCSVLCLVEGDEGEFGVSTRGSEGID